MQAAAVRLFQSGEDLPLLCEQEKSELLATGSLRLEFPTAVLRYAVINGLVLRVMFEEH